MTVSIERAPQLFLASIAGFGGILEAAPTAASVEYLFDGSPDIEFTECVDLACSVSGQIAETTSWLEIVSRATVGHRAMTSEERSVVDSFLDSLFD